MKGGNCKMTFTEKNGLILAKNDRHRIVGFVGINSDGYYFAFGKPSAASFMAFSCKDAETGKEKIKHYWED